MLPDRRTPPIGLPSVTVSFSKSRARLIVRRLIPPFASFVAFGFAAPLTVHAGEIVKAGLVACPHDGTVLGGVNSCGKIWKLKSGEAQLDSNGKLKVQVKSLVLNDSDRSAGCERDTRRSFPDRREPCLQRWRRRRRCGANGVGAVRQVRRRGDSRDRDLAEGLHRPDRDHPRVLRRKDRRVARRNRILDAQPRSVGCRGVDERPRGQLVARGPLRIVPARVRA